MKPRSIENLLKHCVKVKGECMEQGIFGVHFITSATWVDAVTYIARHYDCIPKDKDSPV